MYLKISRFSVLLILAALLLGPTLKHDASAEELHSFGIIGDTKIGVTERVFKKFLKTLDEHSADLAFIVGDVIDEPGNEDEWKRFSSLVGSKKAMFHIAPGNHDINTFKSQAVFRKVTGRPPYYSFTVGDTQFILLNTEDPSAPGKITGKQLSWLRQELTRPAVLRIIFLHRPLFPGPLARGYGLDRHGKERDELHTLFVAAGVAAVFSGHEHAYDRREKDGIPYIITGGGGSVLHRLNEESGGFHHYIIAKRKNRGYLFTVFDTTGKARDRFSIDR